MIGSVYFLFCLLCVLVLFQDFIGICLFNLGCSKYLLKIILSLKDVIAISIAVLGLMTRVVTGRDIRFNATIFFFTGYSLIVAVYFFCFGGLGNIGENVNDLRSLIFPVYAYAAGYTACHLDRERMIKFMERATLLSVTLSLIFYALGDSFLVRIRVLDYTEEVRGYFGMIYKGLPSAYFTKLSAITIFRLAGPVFNSVGTAMLYTFVAGISIAFYRFVRRENSRRVLLGLIMLSIFLTFSRGAILGFILGLLIADALWTRPLKIGRPAVIIYCVIGILFVVFYETFSNIMKDTISLADSSAKGHYAGLIASWEYLKHNWMGRGVGSIGMWRFTDYTGGAGENSFVYIIGQAGIFAIIFLIGAYASVIRKLVMKRDDYLSYGLFICAVAVLFNSIFSPALLVVTPLILFWFFIGYSQAADVGDMMG